MFRRKKKDEPTDAPQAPETGAETGSAETQNAEASDATETAAGAQMETSGPAPAESAGASESTAGVKADAATSKSDRGNRVQKVGTVSSDKMQKTVVVRVDRQVLHPKYRRYVRRTSRFMAHDDLGATVGDRVRIVETRPLSAKKRWRVIEIVQKAAK
ncbi:MAG TPA: 30S ribosomal protein S17 [Pyrinomonadaceae bacterium]|nr:30S ribosomal protein S17 [Pyrinomonadaceae bacterium]